MLVNAFSITAASFFGLSRLHFCLFLEKTYFLENHNGWYNQAPSCLAHSKSSHYFLIRPLLLFIICEYPCGIQRKTRQRNIYSCILYNFLSRSLAFKHIHAHANVQSHIQICFPSLVHLLLLLCYSLTRRKPCSCRNAICRVRRSRFSRLMSCVWCYDRVI